MAVVREMKLHIEQCVQACSLDLYGCEVIPGNKTNILRVYIDGEKPVTSDDCSNVGQHIRNHAAVNFPSLLNYSLEISSPGLDRILFTLDQCRKNIDKKVKCRTKSAINSRKNFTGYLSKVLEDSIELTVESQPVVILWSDVDKIRLIYNPEK